MHEIIIVCGLMGCGKTTFAKEYAKKFNYEYIDFDLEYHKKIQKESIINPLEDIESILKYISDLLNNNKDKNFICDNWFKWSRDWYTRFSVDTTIWHLQKLLKHHKINIIYLFTPFKLCYERYKSKNKENYLIELDNFKETMRKRQEYLLEKISKWVIQ